ncbi:MAG: metalloregulator ArsR/SmtB family transcription factor [Planctomycetota bacterium]
MKKHTESHDKLAALLKVLSVETRLKIFRFLKEKALCVNALAARLDVTQEAVSQHLRIMREAGLLTADKRGYYVHYRVKESACRAWRKTIDRLLQIRRAEGNKARGESACAMRRCKVVKGRKN